MGQLIKVSFSEKDFRPIDKIGKKTKQERKKPLVLQKEALLRSFTQIICSEGYLAEKFLIQDIWDIYVETKESFGKIEGLKAINIAKVKWGKEKWARESLAWIEKCIVNFHSFWEECTASKFGPQEFALDFLRLCHNCDASEVVIAEALDFLKQKKKYFIREQCRNFFVTFFFWKDEENRDFDFKSAKKMLEEKDKNLAWERFRAKSLGASAEDLALEFILLCSKDFQQVEKAISLLQDLDRTALADICAKAVSAIKQSRDINREFG